MKTTAFYFLAIVLFIIFGVAGDMIVGMFNDIAETRDTARQFRTEAAFLRFSTKNIVPNVNQIFVDTSAPKDADDKASVKIRKFRTDRNGVIIGSNSTLPNAKKKIIFLGGSTTECNEVSEPFRFPAVVATILRDLTYRSNSLFLIRYWFSKNAAWVDPPQQIEVTKQSIDLFEEFALSHRAKFEENLVVFIRVARAIGKRPVLMTQPLGRYSAAQQAFNDSIRKVARNEQALLIDLDRQLGQGSDWAFFSDEIHFNRAGSQAVGRFIATALEPVFGVSIEKVDHN